MKNCIGIIATGALLSACGGGAPGVAEFKSASDIRKICNVQAKSLASIYGVRSGGARREEFEDLISKDCCRAMADESKDLDKVQRAYLWYTFAREQDDIYSPREIEGFDQGFNDLRDEMTTSEVLEPERVRMTFTRCVGRAGNEAPIRGW